MPVPKKLSAKAAAIEVLKSAKGQKLPVQELISAVLDTPGVELRGKTPRATVAAQLYTGKEFQKAGRGIVKLAPGAKADAEPKPRPAQRRPKAPAKKATGITKP